jgi:predicted acyl esterase
MVKAGYIFVFQDMRGRFKSEGTFEMDNDQYSTYIELPVMKE